MRRQSSGRVAAFVAFALLICSPGLVGTLPLAAADTTSEAPPSDIVGRSTSSTVLRSDELMVSQLAKGKTTGNWDSFKPDLSGYSSQGGPYATTSRTAMSSPPPISRSARLIDAQSDRVLTLQRATAGDGAILLLSSPNGAVETSTWSGENRPVPTGQVADGETYALTTHRQGLSGQTGSGDLGEQLAVTSAADATAAVQQWTLRAGADGTYRLVNRSDGLCLNVLNGKTSGGAAVGTWPCPDEAAAENEEWAFRQVPSQTGAVEVALQGLGSGRYLSVQENGDLELGSTDVTDSTALWSLTKIYDPASPVPAWSTSVSSRSAFPTALATGDLDRSTNAAGRYGDEAAVAYVDDKHQLQVRVFDYNANGDHFLVTTPDQQLPTVGTTVAGDWYPGSVGLAIGNFDGSVNGTQANQLAVTWQDDAGFHATFMSYTASSGSRDLSVVQSGVPLPRTSASSNADPTVIAVSGLADTTVGDFNGDDVDDLAIAYGAADSVDSDGDYQNPVPWLGIFTFTSELAVNTSSDTQVDANASTDGKKYPLLLSGEDWTPSGIKAAAGLYEIDDSTHQDIRRRQIAVGWPTILSCVDCGSSFTVGSWIRLFGVDDTNGVSAGAAVDVAEDSVTDLDDLPNWPISMSGGGLGGSNAPSGFPTWGLAVGLRGRLVLMRATSGLDLAQTFSDGSFGDDTDINVATYDRDGDSLVLGPPTILTLDQVVKPTLIAAQPPAHSDWLPNPSVEPGAPPYIFENVSRVPDFAVTMSSDGKTNVTNEQAAKSSTSLGVSGSLDEKETFKAGLGGVDDVEGSLEISDKIDKEKTQDQQTTQSNTLTTELQTLETGNDDDVVKATMITFTIYRYPILSGPLQTTDGNNFTSQQWCASQCFGFYEVTVPGKVTDVSNFVKAQQNSNWYQPDWQNGNALSYPRINSDNKVDLPDLGSYTTPGSSTPVTAPLFNGNYAVSDGSTNQTFSIDNATGTTADRSTTSSLTNSKEISAGVKVHVNQGVVNETDDATISGGVTSGSTWSTSTVVDTSTSSTSKFVLNVPQIDNEKAYEAASAFYVDTAGTTKVEHAVSFPNDSWWTRNYSQPDLALNLPDSTEMTQDSRGKYTVPVWNPQDERQLIRGFEALQPVDSTSPITSGQPYTENPAPGESVVFSVRVHNYSLVQSPASSATFYAVPMDASGTKITGSATQIGTSTVPALNAQDVTSIQSPTWTAEGPSTGSQNWRVFVVLDPNNDLGEVHPWKGQPTCPADNVDDNSALIDPMTGQAETLACGQNNQGFGEITVGNDADNTTAATQTSGAQLRGSAGKAETTRSVWALADRRTKSPEDEDQLTPQGTSFIDSRKQPLPVRNGVAQIVAGQQVLGLSRASSTADSSEAQHVLIYDGDRKPENMVAHAKMAGASAEAGGVAWFSWRPTDPGRHTLTEVIVTTTGDDIVHKTTVMVKSHGSPAHLLLKPSTSSTFTGVPVRFTATTTDRYGNDVANQTSRTKLVITPDGFCQRGTCVTDKAGPHTVTGRYRGLTATAQLNVRRATLSLSAIKGSGQQLRPRGQSSPLEAVLTNDAGRPVPHTPVNFTVTSGHATFHGHPTAVRITDQKGRVRSPVLTAGDNAGPIVVTADSGGGGQAQFTLATVDDARGRADLALKITATHQIKAARPALTRLVVSNNGPGIAGDATVDLDLPQGISVVDAGGGRRVGSSVVFALRAIPRGESRTLTLTWTPDRAGLYEWRARTVSTTPDTTMSNNVVNSVIRVR